MHVSEMSPGARLAPVRILFLATAIAFLLGPVGTVLGEAVDHGQAAPGAFGLLTILCGVLLRLVSIHLERVVFGIKQRPWLAGRMSRRQRLILPFSTATVITYGMSCVFSGGTYLLTAPPGWSPLNLVALCFVAVGGLLLGFGASRLVVGLFIIRFSGLWAAPRWAWASGGVVVAMGSVAYAAHCVETAIHLSPAG
jgi:hypothetical protein